MHSAQTTFDRTYITSTEIARRVGVSRVAVTNARRKNLLPDPIMVNEGQIFIWIRDVVEPALRSWEEARSRE